MSGEGMVVGIGVQMHERNRKENGATAGKKIGNKNDKYRF